MKTTNRLLALDVLRGITIASMILVNNPGSWSYVYTPLDHAPWIGLTPTDFIFPFFMFIMGISTYISLQKYDFKYSRSTIIKILKRTFLIYLVGLFIVWLSLSTRTWNNLEDQNLGFFNHLIQSYTNFSHIRLSGVLARLAICYGITAIIGITIKHKYIPAIIAAGLVGYFILLLCGNGFERTDQNILSVVDRFILGLNHMYKDTGNIDPEGIISTIPAICHVLLGFCVGRILMKLEDNKERVLRLFLIGTALTIVGFLLSYGCPISKKIWSPTFVLITCGFGSNLLALLIWIIDIKGYNKWCTFFENFGVNPLFIYVCADVLSILGMNIRFTINGNVTSTLELIIQGIDSLGMDPYFSSLLFALFFVGVNWAIGHILYKKHIYIKL